MEKILKKLQQRKIAGNYRTLKVFEGLTDFCSNDYLGLARSRLLQEAVEKAYHTAAETLHSVNGSTGSRLISGHSLYAEELEAFLAQVFRSESALLFNSGYTANMGVLSTIPQKGDVVFYDELSHACIKDGIRLGFADKFPFRHNDVDGLERKLQKARLSLPDSDLYIVVESVYSMDGDSAPLNDLVALCRKYNALLVVDEAHSTGVFGAGGSGLVDQLRLGNDVFIRVHTFGKAMGSHGACVVAPQAVKDYLINFSRPFIYTTAMPLHALVGIRCAFEFLAAHSELPQQLHSNINLFKKNMGAQPEKLIGSGSAIQAMFAPGNENAKRLAAKVQKKGLDVRPILSPTVKEGSERLRICLHAYDHPSDIEALCSALLFEN